MCRMFNAFNELISVFAVISIHSKYSLTNVLAHYYMLHMYEKVYVGKDQGSNSHGVML